MVCDVCNNCSSEQYTINMTINQYSNTNIQLGISGLLKDTITKGAQGLGIQINHVIAERISVRQIIVFYLQFCTIYYSIFI